MPIFLFLLLLAVGCTASPIPLPERQSAWGRVLTIAQTEQANAPAFTLGDYFIPFAWVGSDERGVHHDVRVLSGVGLSPAAALPLSPIRPSKFKVLPISEDDTLLLYMDANPEGETRLYSAVFAPDTSLKFGPTLISTLRTSPHYTVTKTQDGGVWVVWSGGLLAEPSLYRQALDSLGRPRPPEQIAYDGDHPVFVSNADGTLSLFWLGSTHVYRGDWIDSEVIAITQAAPSFIAAADERLVNFSVGQDHESIYLFWNTVRGDGIPQTWFTSESGGWLSPQQLRLNEQRETDFLTGYNGGSAYTTTSGDTPVSWVVPLQETSDSLPLAAQVGSQLAIVYLRGGEIVGYQPVFELENNLIGLPAFVSDRERHLYLAWSQPAASGLAELNFTTTHPIYSSVVTNTSR